VTAPPRGNRALELEILTTAAGRKALTGFFLSGVLLSFLGAILPAWGFYVYSNFQQAGLYFLVLNLGLVLSFRVVRWVLYRWTIGRILTVASLGGALGLLALAAPVPPDWLIYARLAALAFTGFFAGLLNSTVLYAITPTYKQDPAATLNLAGLLFGAGCLVTALIAAMTFATYRAEAILFWLAMLPLFAAGFYARALFPAMPLAASLESEERRPLREVVRDVQSPGTVLFAMLLFVQFGNEWALAGWLPLMLIQRLGLNPATALLLLALYWTCLVAGRGVAQALLPRFRHSRLLMGSAIAAVIGCLILSATNNVFGAVVALALVGFGFAMIYPLVSEQTGSRFQQYHPAFFSGLFSVAITGGLLAPSSVGYLAERWGIGAVMILPLVGTLLVFFLLVLIRLEARLSSAPGPRRS
jgi:MFS transporter, FHS family, glucose/mannose:H+ symporter